MLLLFNKSSLLILLVEIVLSRTSISFILYFDTFPNTL